MTVWQTQPGLGRMLAASLLAGTFLAPLPAAAQEVTPQATEVKRDVIYVPTPQGLVDRMLQIAEVKKDEYVIDLGSGDGRIPITAAKLGARSLGVEIDPQRLKEAAENLAKVEPDVAARVEFRNQNLFETDLSQADVITMYLLNSINAKLRPKILELEPGTRIVSHAFNMGDWEADETDTVDGKRLYYWIVPAKVEGNWQVTAPEGTFTVKLAQTFQKVTGTADIGGTQIELTDVALRGDRLSATITTSGTARTFVGTVEGDRITPAADAGEDVAKGWTAQRS
jgi:hypothetical protein